MKCLLYLCMLSETLHFKLLWQYYYWGSYNQLYMSCHFRACYSYTHTPFDVLVGPSPRMDLERLPVDLVEILNKITPNEDEVKKFGQFQKDKKKPNTLPDNDRFMFEVRKCSLSSMCLLYSAPWLHVHMCR